MALPKENEMLVRECIKNLLHALGEDPNREGLRETPDRVVRLYSDVLDGNFAAYPKVTTFKEENYGGMVNVHHFPFYSFCEHHLVPFQGTAAIAYIPGKVTVGLSKLVRIFRYHCKRITIQERLTHDVLADIDRLLHPQGAIVWACAEHMCMTLRGVKSPGSKTTTTAYSGVFRTDLTLRNAFLQEVIQR